MITWMVYYKFIHINYLEIDALDEFTSQSVPLTRDSQKIVEQPPCMDDEFVKQLAKNMELLLKQELNDQDSIEIQDSVKQLTSVLSDIPTASSTSTLHNEPVSIQDHVSKTINKLKESDLKVQVNLN